ncbi:Inositol monophosphatase family protein [Rhodovulum sp. P5]|uniref:inositol monophosphatase family protein n=1 Tax=Rhodovulum sp. P5 TaxID=1564506 RepID=UPI0009C27DC5|nr:3'(2'),5'-bisphosphate nucleotidase CysQ [Rhodovulum sp. P5]ARE41425.1 Inositol monophosphatase family protein [Rhodovulum sp. P5]
MPGTDLALLTEAAQEAGAIARHYWRRDPQTWDKPDKQGPVTEADIAVNDMLRERLLSARPDYGWLSEETEDDAGRLTAARCFIVDPIDGTRDFIQGGKSFAHAIAVAEAGTVIAAAVYLPVADKLYTAAAGAGARLNDRPIHASQRAKLDGASILTARPALDPGHWAGPPPRVRRSLRASLAYRLCLVAQGRYDAMITLRDSWDWDTAAGSLIAAEAGATVTDRAGRPLRFDGPRPTSHGVLAGAPMLHGELVARLA